METPLGNSLGETRGGDVVVPSRKLMRSKPPTAVMGSMTSLAATGKGMNPADGFIRAARRVHSNPTRKGAQIPGNDKGAKQGSEGNIFVVRRHNFWMRCYIFWGWFFSWVWIPGWLVGQWGWSVGLVGWLAASKASLATPWGLPIRSNWWRWPSILPKRTPTWLSL